MKAVNGSLISVHCDDNAFDNCSQVFKEDSSALSGYYTIRAPNGSLISVYCDMEGSNCDDKGGWMRLVYLNMSEIGATCPSGLISYFFQNFSYPLCDRPHPSMVAVIPSFSLLLVSTILKYVEKSEDTILEMLMVFMIIIKDLLHLKGLMLMVCLLLVVITLVIIFGHI